MFLGRNTTFTVWAIINPTEKNIAARITNIHLVAKIKFF